MVYYSEKNGKAVAAISFNVEGGLWKWWRSSDAKSGPATSKEDAYEQACDKQQLPLISDWKSSNVKFKDFIQIEGGQ